MRDVVGAWHNGAMSAFANAEAYHDLMGRWSRALGNELIRFARLLDGTRILDVGCGIGSFSDAVLTVGQRTTVVGIDPSPAFVAGARARIPDRRASFAVGDAQRLAFPDGAFDAAVAMLVLNFVPDPSLAVAEMCRVTSEDGLVAACVWDYGGGMTMMNRFWEAAVALDPAAASSHEAGMRFAHAGELGDAWRAAGLEKIREEPLEIRMRFTSFDDYWQPFLGGVGPSGAYVASISPDRRQALEAKLRAELWENRPETSRTLTARAWAVVGTVPES